MATYNIGKLGFRYLGPWNNSTYYEFQDLVEYNNSIYIFKNGTPAMNQLPTTSFWDLYSKSSNSIATTTGTLIYFDGSDLAGFPMGADGQILTATSRQVLEYDVTLSGTNYVLTETTTSAGGANHRVELTDGDVVTFNFDISAGFSTSNPIVLGGSSTAPADLLDSSHGVDYRVDGQSFPNAAAFVHRLNMTTESSVQIIWEVPEGFGNSSNAFYYDFNTSYSGGQIGVVDYTTANNPIELKWKSYINESPRKVLKLPDSRHSVTDKFAAFAMKDNSIRTIGNGSRYRHGNGSENNHEYPNLVALPNTFPGISSYKIAPYSSLVYVVDTNNELWIWGTGNVGEHGQGGAPSREFRVPEKAVLPIGITNVLEVIDIHSANPSTSSTRDNNCTMLLATNGTNNKLISSGYNELGQLGHTSDTNTVNFDEVDLTNLGANTISSVCGTGEPNGRTFFLLDNNSNLYSWGSNYHGTLGRSNSANYLTVFNQPTIIPYFVSNGISVQKVITSKHSAYAIDTANKLYVWGGNEAGQLGLGDIVSKYFEPQYVADNVADVFVAPYDNEIVFLLMTDGTLRSAGNVMHGAIGQGITGPDAILTFTDVTTPSNVSIDNVLKVAVGGTGIFRSSALLKNDGTVMVCGYNGKGQLGLGDTTSRNYFEELNIRDYIKDIHWFGSSQDTILTLHTENDDVYICGSGTEGLSTQLRENNYLVPTPLIF